MKKLFFFLAVAIVAFLGSCEKDATVSNDVVNFSIDASALPTATNFLVSLVPSEETDVAFSVDAYAGSNQLMLKSAEKKSLQPNAYFSVIAFDSDNNYLVQNFFPFVEGEQILTLTEE